MILCWRRHGKAGGCRIPLKTIRWMRFEIERTHRNGWTICDEDVLTYTSREVLFHITGFYQWFISSSLSRLWMTDKLQSSMYLENCILKIWYKVQTERFCDKAGLHQWSEFKRKLLVSDDWWKSQSDEELNKDFILCTLKTAYSKNQ